MPKPLQQNGRYMPGIDGLRALAVFAVIAYHLNFSWAQGGLLGVGVFFVLSGYLITDQIIAQWKRNGRLALKDFWIRRARRLLPAMLVMLLVVTAWIVLFDRSRLNALGGDVISSITYVNNWWLIFHKVSYFESFGPASPLGHLWSLAVEEQFYLLWPLIIAVGLRFAPQRGKLALLTLAGAALSALAMIMLYDPELDPSRVYYGTDTRAFALLIGAALAIVWPSSKLKEQVTFKSRISLDFVGLLGLGIILLMIYQTNEYDSSLYYGGLVLLSLVTAVVVAVLAHPASGFGKAMGSSFLRWFGVRSYGIYLWHYPVIVLTSPEADTGEINVLRTLLQLSATIFLAALSYKYIEDPIRRGTWRQLWNREADSRMQRGRDRARSRRAWMLGLAGSVLLLGMFVYKLNSDQTSVVSAGADGTLVQNKHEDPASKPGTTVIPNAKNPNGHDLVTQKPDDKVQDDKKPNSKPVEQPDKESSKESGKETGKETNNNTNKKPDHQSKPDSTQAEKPAKDNGKDPNDVVAAKPDNNTKPPQPDGIGKGIVAIGDSVILDAQPYLEKLLPGIIVDGKVGRQFAEAQSIIDGLIASGKLGNQVIIELGTNGPFTKKQLSKLLASLGDKRHVILVNVRVPRKWQDTVNTTIEDVAAGYPNVTVVDWYSASKDHDDFFYKDGVHLKPKGSQFYASLLVQALQSNATELNSEAKPEDALQLDEEGQIVQKEKPLG